MLKAFFKRTVWLLWLLDVTFADYDCMCNYNVETPVYATAVTGSQPLGYLYEFDCKPLAANTQNTNNFYTVQFEKQLGYVEKNAQEKIQMCPGDPPGADLIPATTMAVGSVGTVVTSNIATQSTSASQLSTTISPTTLTISSTTIAVTPPSTTPYSYWLMAANVTGTPLQYVGIGYNLLTGNPESISDPGFKTSSRIFQLTGNSSSVREVLYRETATCTTHKFNTFIHGSKSYQNELLQFVNPSATHDSSITESAFTYNAAFESFKDNLDNSSNFYMDIISNCKLGSAKYRTDLADKNNFTITKEFAKDICSLPTEGNSTVEYMAFLDKWGTSIVTLVDIGERSIERYHTTADQIIKNTQLLAPDLIEHKGAYQGYKSSLSINPSDFKNSPAAANPFGTHQTISMGTSQHPVPVGAQLVPISDALNWIYWEPIVDELMAEGICSDSIYGTGMKHYLNYIQTALSQYVGHTDSKTGISHTPLDHGIQVPISWPVGTYGLMQTAHGCPADQTVWLSGWRRQDTEDLRSKNSFSSSIASYMKGDFASNNIKTYFCIKSRPSITAYDQTWQEGSYCLLKHGSCPKGFSSGYVYWDDEDLNNDNSRGGTLPDGTYDKNTKIYYCCRNDGSVTTPLLLPTEKPFILVRYGRTCQAVHGMHVRNLYVHWDDEDLGNKDSSGGMHPLDDGGSHNHQLHYCYYYTSGATSIVG